MQPKPVQYFVKFYSNNALKTFEGNLHRFKAGLQSALKGR